MSATSRVALDSCVVVKGFILNGQSNRIFATNEVLEIIRARMTIKSLSQKNCVFVLPTLVVSELLRKDGRESVLTDIRGVFLPSFDLIAARIAAKIYPIGEELVEDGSIDKKSRMKIDVAIVANAISSGCESIYSTDKGVRALASRSGLSAPNLFDHNEDLFEDNELRRKTAEEFRIPKSEHSILGIT